MVPAGVWINAQWRVADFYADSGAFYTLMHATFATGFGRNYKAATKVFVQVGDGGLIPIYLHQLPMQIGAKQFQATVGFSDKFGVGFNLLGRRDVFEHFKTCFSRNGRSCRSTPLDNVTCKGFSSSPTIKAVTPSNRSEVLLTTARKEDRVSAGAGARF